MKKSILLLLSTCLLLISLNGCQTASTMNSQSLFGNQQALRLTIPYHIKRFDSAIANDSFSMNILSNTGEGLMRLNENHQPVLGIASQITVSSDQTVYTFHLREAKWSDGSSVTAQDFEKTWKRTLAKSTQSPNAYLFFSIINAESYHHGEVDESKVGIHAIDEKTFEVRLKQPMRQFLNLITCTPFLPQKADHLNKHGATFGTDPTQMVYNGPFVISGISETGTIVLNKNRSYWDQKNVTLEKTYFYVSNNAVRNLNLYNANQIDMTRIHDEFTKAYHQSPEFHRIQTSATQYIRFNEQNHFLQNKKIRQAINLAIDRHRLVQQIHNEAEPAGGLIPPTMKGENQSFREEHPLPAPSMDIQRAKQLFQEGLTELGLQKAPERLVLLSYEDERKQLAIELKKQLKEHLGLNVLLNTTSRSEKLTLEESGKFDMTLSDWAATYPDPITMLETFTTHHPQNTGKYSDSPYDETIKRAINSSSVSQQMNYLRQAERFLLVDDQAFIPLYYVNETYLLKSHIKKFVRHPFGIPNSLRYVQIVEQ
ncbi:peptide ABC transporter substrate-binding protein [Hazenella coriacea]|uniref:Oligopeptide transport system substrate-binding protein n=1 Tax=Hazenella coriacea TaxID=1179467 RepID=A0A4R3LAF0_9BACL|nr:peptide ABC transporter substrate-binding protein [Hazenella coriacea]TCS96719.1 oligopeptide transport system substrate-binding protein [Hazenella coriacea]